MCALKDLNNIMTVAVIDIGSNSVRMGVYSKVKDKITLIDAVRHSSRLSEGLSEDSLLKDIPINRTLSALKSIKEHLDLKFPDTEIICVATEALRRAKNKDAFIESAKNLTGIHIKILDGEKEAVFGVFGASLSAQCDNFYMLDTGGGSFELVLYENNHIQNRISLPYGAVVLTETFNPDQNGTGKLNAFMKDVFDSLPWVLKKGYPVVILGGSNRVLGKLYKKCDTDFNQDGMKISIEDVKSIIRKVTSLPKCEREILAGMEKNRADIITAGLTPLSFLIEKADPPHLIISTNSIREGIANEYFNK